MNKEKRVLDLKKTPLAIAVQGYKGGGNRTPVEAPNTLKSSAIANLLDLISEGPIVGLVDGLKSVYLDETPVESSNGTRNFTNFQIDYRLGTPDQSFIPGFDSVENEISVGVELKQGSPFIRQFTNTNLDAIRVRLSVPALHKTNKENGDISGTSVAYQIAISTDNGPYNTVLSTSFNGKTMNKYERDHKIDLPPANQGWSIRVTRSTPNSTASELQNQTFVESLVEVIEAKLRYPNSAVIGVKLEASQFSNIPGRAYDVKGRIIRVPTNYNPEDRSYSGVWDGTFKLAWTDNPAWIYYDLATHPRYGLGHLITDLQVNKWVLYSIAQYCDGLVPNGRGGQEPRFTCNMFLQKQADAYKVLQDLATVFRGIAYWANGEIQAIQDRPDEPVFMYSPANVIAGKFGYEGTARKTRFNVALVSWNDLTNMGRAAIEYVDDPEGIARYGIQQTDVTAVGCTSQGQAQRVGRYLLATSKYETQSVTFQVGLDGTLVAPGKIILINDPLRAGIRLGGRITAGPDNHSVFVDGEPGQIEIGDTLRVALPDGTMESRTVSSINGNQIIVSVAFTQAPQDDAMWSAERANVQALRYRVLAVTEEDGKVFTITAIRHVEGKFSNADNGTRIDPPKENQMTPVSQDSVTDLALTSYNAVDYVSTSQVVVASWNAPKNAVKFQVEWKRDSGPWTKLPETEFTIAEIRDAWFGTYLVRVRAVNSNNILSQPVTSQPFVLSALTTPPGVIVEIDDKVQDNYEEMIRKDAENAQAIVDEALARTQKDVELAQADADEAAARAAADAQEAIDRAAAIDAAVADLEAQIAAIDIGDILGAEKWDKTKSYLATTLVVSEGKLYRAKIDVPANTEITNATYWEPIGNYAELVDEVKAQAAVVSQHTTQITNINGQISTLSTDMTQVKSRLTNAEGTITANSSAINALQTNVTNLNNTVTANSSAITQLQTDMVDAKQGISANAGAITGLTTRVSNAEGLITSQGQAITKVQAGLGNIGGDNLLNNSSFENRINDVTPPTGWGTAFGGSMGSIVHSYVDSPLAGSTKAWRVTGTAASGGATQILGLSESVTAANLIKAVPGQKHTLSAFMRGTATNATALLIIWYYNSAGTSVATHVSPAVTLDAANFNRFTFTVPTAAPANTVEVRAQLRLQTTVAGNYTFEIDNAQLQLGEVATNWMPSALEVAQQAANTASALTSLTATVTQQGNTITSQGNAITNLQTAVAGKADAQALVDLTSRVVVTENSITSLNSSVTTLNSNMSNIGGDNLLSNSSFEQGEPSGLNAGPGWNLERIRGDIPCAFSRVPSMLTGGGNALRLEWTAANAEDWAGVNRAGPGAGYMRIKPLTDYVLSTWVRGTAGTRFQIYVVWFNETGGTGMGTITSQFVFATGEWQRLILPARSPSGEVKRARAYVGRQFAVTPGNYWMEVDNVMLQEGLVATAWTPSANEVATLANASASAITSLTTRVTNAEGTITTQGGQITTLNNSVNGVAMNGANWMFNSNFATGLEWWSVSAGAGNSIVWGAAAGQTGGGVTFTRGTGTSQAPYVLGRNGLWMPSQTDKPRNFRAVIIAKLTTGSSATVTARMRVRTTNTSDGGTIGESNNDQQITITDTNWKRYVFNFGPALNTRNEFMFQFWVGTEGTAVTFDRIEVYDMTEQLVGEANAAATTALTTRVTAAEGAITSTSQNITQLSNSISLIQGGSSSIWQQGTFEQWADGTVLAGNQAGGTSATVRAAAARQGVRGMEWNVTANTSPTTNADLYMGNFVSISGARKIYVEFWAKLADTSIDAPTGTFGVGINTQSETGANNWPRTNTAINTLSKTEWTKISGYLTTNVNTARMRMFLSIPGTGSSGNRQVGTVIWVDDIVWMDVTDAVNAQASTDALSTALSSLTSTVTTQGNTIASQGTSITNLDNKLLGVRNLGGNLIPNADFQYNPFIQNWWMADAGGTGNDIQWGAAYGDGKSGVRITRGGTGAPFIATGNTVKSGNQAAGWFPAVAGSVFRVTARAKLWMSGSGNVLFRLFRKLEDGSVNAYNDIYIPGGGATNAWADYNLDFPACPANTIGVFLRVYVHPNAGTVDFDKIELRNVTGEVAANAAASAVSSLTTRVTAAEGSITSQGTQITSLQNSIAGVRGGKNMISNGLFDMGGDVGWTIASGTWTFPAEGRNGSLCAKRVGPGNTTPHTLRANADASTPVTAGKTYRISCWYKNDAAWNGTPGNSKMRLADQGGNLLNTVGNIWFAPNKTEWTYTEGLYTVPSASSTVTGLRLTIVLDNAAGTIWIDDVWLEEVSGEVANSSAITTLQSTVTQQGNTLTGQASQITSLTTSIAGKADASIVTSLETKVNANMNGGGNLLVNATFATDISGWGFAWNPGGWWLNRDTAGADWTPYGGHTIGMNKAGVLAQGNYGVVYPSVPIPATAGKRYMFSCKTAGHRSRRMISMKFMDVNGNNLAEPQSTWTDSAQTGSNGGKALSNWNDQVVTAIAPTGTVAVVAGFWADGRGESDPYCWYTQPMLEEVPLDKTTPSPYAPGGADAYASYSVYTDVNGYIAGIQLKNSGTQSSFTILADQFRIVKPGSNLRTEYSDGNWRAYDGNGVLRVRMGVW
jgi:predicted phage tail protein